MDRERAMNILRARLKKENLLKHCLATEAIMRKLAEELGEDPEMWGLAGLVHDIDYEECTPETHGEIGAEILKSQGFPEEIIRAVRHHNYMNYPSRDTRLEVSLVASDSITGLIVACALVKKGKISEVTLKTVKKKLKDRSFAGRVNRDMIREIEKIGVPLDRFIEISLDAMKDIAGELGLE